METIIELLGLIPGLVCALFLSFVVIFSFLLIATKLIPQKEE